MLREGIRSPAVGGLQSALNELKLVPNPLEIDAVFGPKTCAAVKALQSRYKLKSDGVFGPLTSAALLATLISMPVRRGTPP